jgi:hypothetical protein
VIFRGPRENSRLWALAELILSLPATTELTLQLGGDSDYTLGITRNASNPRFILESNQGSGLRFGGQANDRHEPMRVALSWAHGESEWRRLIPWERIANPVHRTR